MTQLFRSSLNKITLLLFLAGPVALIVGFPSDSHLFEENQVILEALGMKEGDDSTPKPSPSPHIDLLLHGEVSQTNTTLRWREVFEAKPESPIHFARYLQGANDLPDDFRETVDRIAPDNGWFDLFEIAQTAPETLQEIEPEKPPAQREPKSLPLFKITNQEEFERCLSLFHQAAQKNQFTDYSRELIDLFVSDLSPPKTWLEQLTYTSQVAGLSSAAIEIQKIVQFLEAACQQFREENDHKGFLRLEKDVKAISRKLHTDCHSLISAIILNNFLRRISSQFTATARLLELPRFEGQYRKLNVALENRRETAKFNRESGISEHNSRLALRHGSVFMMISGSINRNQHSEKLNREDLEASVRAEKAVFSRLFTSAGLLLFTALGIDFWIRKRCVPESNLEEVDDPTNPLHLPSQWRVAICGAFIPFCLLMVIRYLTPLGQLDYSVFAVYLSQEIWAPFHALPFLATFLVLGATLITCVRHTVDRNRQMTRRDLIFIGLPAASYFFNGCYLILDENPFVFHLAVWPALISLLWLALRLINHHLSKEPHAIVRNNLAIPALFLIAGLFGIWTWALTIEERYWISHDRIGTPDGHFITKYEARMFAQSLEELELLLP